MLIQLQPSTTSKTQPIFSRPDLPQSSSPGPRTIQYTDLTFLNLKHLTRVLHLMLIPDEWGTVIGLLNRRRQGILGRAIFTGSSGIGEHEYPSPSFSDN
jgi:hypothetical protein